MMIPESQRTSRIEARITPDALALVRRAAELQGCSLSDFLVSAAKIAAHKTIEAANIIRLSADDQIRFVDGMLNPSPKSKAILQAFKHNNELFGGE